MKLKWEHLGQRERDELIIVHVMGWKRTSEYPSWVLPDGDARKWDDVEPYSQDITAAWEVVKEMQRKGFSFSFQSGDTRMKLCTAGFTQLISGQEVWIPYTIWAKRVSPSQAICLAALKALGVGIE